ncbi:MAG: hypothetical protein EPO25_18140 [Gammaproteobacteria bacterium]|nr:MAG: hypothetical protein EPO25_18140 [Gammaproteobacteria bacterium]
MLTLRWILGSIIVLVGGGFVALSIVAGGFRRSFGASSIHPLLTLLPLVAMVLLLAALMFPAKKLLLHAAALAAVALVVFCIWQLVSESATVLWWALLYLGGWLVFYWLATASLTATIRPAARSVS